MKNRSAVEMRMYAMIEMCVIMYAVTTIAGNLG